MLRRWASSHHTLSAVFCWKSSPTMTKLKLAKFAGRIVRSNAAAKAAQKLNPFTIKSTAPMRSSGS
ncbi:hypothetical protein HYPGJ_30757 [Hyphomicrobium sp. GJ21]|nr:hypothetical protein HYPGJ_30757 [Hyphomicrobium sp. GJ21]